MYLAPATYIYSIYRYEVTHLSLTVKFMQISYSSERIEYKGPASVQQHIAGRFDITVRLAKLEYGYAKGLPMKCNNI